MPTVAGKTLVNWVVNIATSGVNQIVPGVPGKLIYICNYFLVSAGAVTVTWQDNSATPVKLSGAKTMVAGTPFLNSTDPPSYVLATTVAGKDLDLLLSAATQVSGHITGWIE